MYAGNLTDVGGMRELLARHGFSFSKALGQNFLINPSVCPRMAEACREGMPERFAALEIGPGIGVLTRELAGVAEKVVSVELDRRLLPVLAETVGECSNVEIVQGDAMKLDLAELIRRTAPGLPLAVCANLPYYITSPLLMRLLESRLPARSITVLVQKEAAERLCARPGTRACGAVTLAVEYYARAERLFAVSRGSFLPPPKVDSTVMRLWVREEPPCLVEDEAAMFRLIRAAFGQRRLSERGSAGRAHRGRDFPVRPGGGASARAVCRAGRRLWPASPKRLKQPPYGRDGSKIGQRAGGNPGRFPFEIGPLF